MPRAPWDMDRLGGNALPMPQTADRKHASGRCCLRYWPLSTLRLSPARFNHLHDALHLQLAGCRHSFGPAGPVLAGLRLPSGRVTTFKERFSFQEPRATPQRMYSYPRRSGWPNFGATTPRLRQSFISTREGCRPHLGKNLDSRLALKDRPNSMVARAGFAEGGCPLTHIRPGDSSPQSVEWLFNAYVKLTSKRFGGRARYP